MAKQNQPQGNPNNGNPNNGNPNNGGSNNGNASNKKFRDKYPGILLYQHPEKPGQTVAAFPYAPGMNYPELGNANPKPGDMILVFDDAGGHRLEVSPQQVFRQNWKVIPKGKARELYLKDRKDKDV